MGASKHCGSERGEKGGKGGRNKLCSDLPNHSVGVLVWMVAFCVVASGKNEKSGYVKTHLQLN